MTSLHHIAQTLDPTRFEKITEPKDVMQGCFICRVQDAYEFAANVFQFHRKTNILCPTSTAKPRTQEKVKLCAAKTPLFLSDRYREIGQISQIGLSDVFLQARSN